VVVVVSSSQQIERPWLKWDWGGHVAPPCACGWVDLGLECVTIGAIDENDAEYRTWERQRSEAWRRHVRHTRREMLRNVPLAELKRRYAVQGKVLKRFGTWAVTTYGLECLTDPYWIEAARLSEPYWSQHMANKTWVLVEDFEPALAAARARHAAVT
jgi:hypothetical protein